MSPSPLLRNTPYGPVEGAVDADGTWSWKGIPFAQPPVGDLRWRAPREPEPWTEARPAKASGSACVQLGSLFGPGEHNTFDASVASSLYRPVGSEDCLYLNLWRPATEEAGLPVLFFLHGGSNLYGYNADPLYDGAALARTANAVVVTANYRLGLFGWFHLPGVLQDEASGNFGTLDQIQALTFVQRGIAAFGGDPGNVTLLGQSSGAVNSHALLTSPLLVAEPVPLFHKAVLMSGALAAPGELPPGAVATLQAAAYGERQARTLLDGLLIAGGLAADEAGAQAYAAAQPEGAMAAFLRSRSPAQIFQQLIYRLAPAGLAITYHIPDGRIVAHNPMEALRKGLYLQVPLIISTTRDEGTLFPGFLALAPALGGVSAQVLTDADRLRHMLTFDGDAPTDLTPEDIINPAYLPVDAPFTGYRARMATLSQFFFIALRDALLDALSPAEAPHATWYFEFDWSQAPSPWDVVYGAAHAYDLPFLFGTFQGNAFAGLMNSTANEPGRLALSRAMMDAVAAFARTGDPNTPSLGTPWPQWPRTLVFDATRTEKRIFLR